MDEIRDKERPFGPRWQERIDRKALALETARSLLTQRERDTLDKYAAAIGDKPGRDVEGLELRMARANELFPQAGKIEQKLANLQQKILESGKG